MPCADAPLNSFCVEKPMNLLMWGNRIKVTVCSLGDFPGSPLAARQDRCYEEKQQGHWKGVK